MASFKGGNKRKIYSRFFLGDLLVDYEKEQFTVGNETVTHVDLIGTIVSLFIKGNVKLFDIEDGSGKIRCCQFLQDENKNAKELEELLELYNTDRDLLDISPVTEHLENLQEKNLKKLQKNLDSLSRRVISVLAAPRYQPKPLQLGDLVNISGRLNIFRSEGQIVISHYRHIQDVNEIWYRMFEIEKLNAILDRKVELYRYKDISNVSKDEQSPETS